MTKTEHLVPVMVISRQHAIDPFCNGRVLLRLACWLLLAALSLNTSFAISLETGPNQWIIENWQTEDGLAQNSVNGIVQDEDGFLWLGTEAGLSRFDGVQFDNFHKRSQPVLPYEYIHRMHLGRDGTIWLGARVGGLIKKAPGRNVAFSKVEEFPNVEIWGFAEDKAGTLWIGTRNGIYQLNNGQVSPFKGNADLNSPQVTALHADPHGTIWIGTDEAGIYRWVDNHLEEIPPKNFWANGQIRAFQTTPEGDVWIGTEGDGLFRYRDGELEHFDLLPKALENVHSLKLDRNGALWVGLQHDGVARVWGDTIDLVNTENGLTANHVVSFLEDEDGSIWIGTEFGGLNRIREGLFRSLTRRDGLPDQNVTCVLGSEDGLWIGTMDQGLFLYKEGNFETIPLGDGTQEHIRALARSSRSDLWIGTAGAGLGFYNGKTTRFFTRDDGLPNQEITSLFVGPKQLWIGLRGALATLDFSTSIIRKVVIPELSTNDFARVISMDPHGHLWIATQRGALIRQTVDGFTLFMKPDSSNLRSFRSLYFDQDGILWAGTRESGLLMIKPGTAPYFFTTDSGLVANMVLDVFEDDQHRFWFSNFRGIQRVNKSDLLAVYQGKRQRLDAHLYNEKDGIRTTDFNGGYSPSACMDAKGKLWFATRRGVVGISPKKTNFTIKRRSPYIMAVLADGHYYPPLASGVVLPPDSRNVTIRFTAPLLNIPSKVAFRYKLDGLDYAWSEPSPRREITWFNLKPGQYTFHATVQNEDGIWSESPATIRFKIRPHFYQTGWFYILAGALVITLARGVYLLRVRALMRRKAHLENEIRIRTLDLQRTNMQLENEISERRISEERLALYSGLGQKLHSVSSQETAAEIILQTAGNFFHFDSAFIELYDPQKNTLKMLLQMPPLTGVETKSLERTPGKVELDVIRTGGKVGPRLTLAPPAAKAGTAMLVPIRNAQRTIGIICLETAADGNYAPEQVKMLQSLADYCAGAFDRLHASRALEESERRFLAFMSNTPALAWMKNSRFEYAYISEPLAQLHNRPPREIIGKDDFELFPTVAAKTLRRNDEHVLATGKTIEVYEKVPSKGGGESVFWVFKFPFIDSSGEKYVGGMGVDVTAKQQAEEALRALPYDIIQAQETERRRVARELHDSVSQVLSSIKFRLHAAETQILNKDRKWLESYGKAKELLNSASQQVRQISRNLRPGELDDLGLHAAIRETSSEFQERTGIQVTLHLVDLNYRFSPSVELNLFRIFQEALNNVEKYSKAKTLEVQLQVTRNKVLFQLTDDGVGFKQEGKQLDVRQGGLGLRHMQERASFMGGDLDIITSPGTGTSIKVEIPLPMPGRDQPKAPDENLSIIS